MHTLGRCHSLLRSFGCSPPPPSRRVGIARVSLFARLAQMDGQVFEPSLLSRSKEERPSASLRLRHSAPTPSRAGVWLTLANWRGKSVFFAFFFAGSTVTTRHLSPAISNAALTRSEMETRRLPLLELAVFSSGGTKKVSGTLWTKWSKGLSWKQPFL